MSKTQRREATLGLTNLRRRWSILTCRDAGNDEPEHASHSSQDPAPVRNGRVGVAIGCIKGVVADLDHCCSIVRQLHADYNDPAHTIHCHCQHTRLTPLRHILHLQTLSACLLLKVYIFDDFTESQTRAQTWKSGVKRYVSSMASYSECRVQLSMPDMRHGARQLAELRTHCCVEKKVQCPSSKRCNACLHQMQRNSHFANIPTVLDVTCHTQRGWQRSRCGNRRRRTGRRGSR